MIDVASETEPRRRRSRDPIGRFAQWCEEEEATVDHDMEARIAQDPDTPTPRRTEALFRLHWRWLLKCMTSPIARTRIKQRGQQEIVDQSIACFIRAAKTWQPSKGSFTGHYHHAFRWLVLNQRDTDVGPIRIPPRHSLKDDLPERSTYDLLVRVHGDESRAVVEADARIEVEDVTRIARGVLTKREMDAFETVYLMDMKNRPAAERLGISKQRVDQLCGSLRRKLRKAIPQ